MNLSRIVWDKISRIFFVYQSTIRILIIYFWLDRFFANLQWFRDSSTEIVFQCYLESLTQPTIHQNALYICAVDYTSLPRNPEKIRSKCTENLARGVFCGLCIWWRKMKKSERFTYVLVRESKECWNPHIPFPQSTNWRNLDEELNVIMYFEILENAKNKQFKWNHFGLFKSWKGKTERFCSNSMQHTWNVNNSKYCYLDYVRIRLSPIEISFVQGKESLLTLFWSHVPQLVPAIFLMKDASDKSKSCKLLLFQAKWIWITRVFLLEKNVASYENTTESKVLFIRLCIKSLN